MSEPRFRPGDLVSVVGCTPPLTLRLVRIDPSELCGPMVCAFLDRPGVIKCPSWCVERSGS